jgi:hypothetical protein
MTKVKKTETVTEEKVKTYAGFDTIIKEYAFIGFPKETSKWPEYFASLYNKLNSEGKIKKFSKDGPKRATPKRCEGILSEMAKAYKAKPVDIGNNMVVLVPEGKELPTTATVVETTGNITVTADQTKPKRKRNKSKK